MKTRLGSLNASPHKRLYHSIIADYTPELSIYELIDNAIDNGKRYKVKKIVIEILFDEIQNSICVSDNSGGIPHDELKNIVSPGRTGNSGSEDTIGIFGVGSKRGVISLSEKISIKSRYSNKHTYLIEYDDMWIGDDDNWNIEYFQIDDIAESTTIVELSKLRGVKVSDLLSGGIVDKISKVYGLLLETGEIDIKINGSSLKPILPLGNWSYPKGFFPKILKKTAIIDSEEINYEIHVGLTLQGSPQGKYGVTFYGNKRLICEYVKNEDVGYIAGKASSPHPTKSLFQAIVLITGPSKLIPWNSSKSGINYQKSTYKDIISEDIIHAVVEYSRASVYLSKQPGSWAAYVEPFKTGKIDEVILTPSSSSRSYILPTGKIRKSKAEKIIDDNQIVIDSMPWTKGLMESILAVEIIQKQNFEQKNRISLILIDSNFEIGLKEYLVNNVRISIKDFNSIKENRSDVIKRVEKENSGNAALINLLAQTNYYYNIRNNFIHQKATATVNDTELVKYDNIIKEIFKILFGFIF